MCGVAGIFSHGRESVPIDERELTAISDHMRKRGPDGAGMWVSPDKRVGLAHRRLAVIDLSPAGAQPMWSHDERLCIVFNGEIYNYRELRAELAAEGAVFRSDSDTEVLLQLYERRGERMCTMLRGMFTFAIWDNAALELFLARDTFGIKPLYYTDGGGVLRFASQVKALCAGGAIGAEIEPAAAAGFLVWGHVPEPWTTVKGVHSLPAGSWLRVSRANPPEVRAFLTAEEVIGSEDLAGSRGRVSLHDALSESVRHHLVADVPVGLFLSAGVDSTVLAALVRDTGARLTTLTLGFEEFRGTPDDETIIAHAVATRLGTDHHTLWTTRKHFAEELPAVLDAMDQPTTDGLNTYFVARAARQVGLKVAISGLGGDEFFRGYPSFRQLPRAVRTLQWANRMPGVGRQFERQVSKLASRSGGLLSPKAAGLLRYGGTYGGAFLLRRALRLPEEILRDDSWGVDRATLQAGLERLSWPEVIEPSLAAMRSDDDKVTFLEATCYMRSQLLRDTDWASMAHSLEIRVPLVDVRLARQVVANRRDGMCMDKKALGCAPRSPLPAEVLTRPKTGFRVPVGQWLSHGQDGAEPGLRGWQRLVWKRFSEAAQR
jgi:asparagine synthase (glutamine-hydrolysing)